MSYDICCYRSALGYPDVDEAMRLTSDETDERISNDQVATIDRIAKALTDYNPDFIRFEFDYQQIAVLEGITVEEAQRKFRHIELNTPDGALATQIQIVGSSASITIPYWYTGKSAAMVFEKVNQYLKIIRKEAGYLVFDPQTGKAYDPENEDIDGLFLYTATTEHTNEYQESPKLQPADEPTKSGNTKPKPWWKFW